MPEFVNNSDNPFVMTEMKSVQSYGIKVVANTADPRLNTGINNTKPVISFYDSYTKAIFDYSHCENRVDLSVLNFLQTAGSSGVTFTLSNATYQDPRFSYTSNLGGTYIMSGITNSGKVIFANVGFSFSGYSGFNRYSSDNFVGVPGLTFTGLTAPLVSFIENKISNENERTFTNLGIYGTGISYTQYVEISGSTWNSGVFASTDFVKTNDGTEYIFATGITNEDRITSNSTVKLYERGTVPTYIRAQDEDADGTIKIFDEDGSVLKVLENQNAKQAYVKKYTYPDNVILWQEGVNSISFDEDSATNIDELFANWDCCFSLVALDEVTSGAWWLINNSYRNTISVSSAFTAMKIDVSHYSLAGSYLSLSSNSSYADDVQKYVVRSGEPGTPGAAIFVQITSNLPNPLYIVSSDTSIGAVITVTTNV